MVVLKMITKILLLPVVAALTLIRWAGIFLNSVSGVGENKYMVFFKAPDADAMTAAFTEYTQNQVKKASRPTILQRMEHFKSLIQHPKKDKTRHKEPER